MKQVPRCGIKEIVVDEVPAPTLSNKGTQQDRLDDVTRAQADPTFVEQ